MGHKAADLFKKEDAAEEVPKLDRNDNFDINKKSNDHTYTTDEPAIGAMDTKEKKKITTMNMSKLN